MVELLLLILAAICFLASIGPWVSSRWNLMALGLFLWVLTEIIGGWPG